MAGNIDGVAQAFLTAFGPRPAQIYTHAEIGVAEPFLARGLDVVLRLTDSHAVARAERCFPGRAAVWDLEGWGDARDRVVVLYDPFGRGADANAPVIAWLCRRCPGDVLLVLSTDRSRDLADLEAAMALAGYEFHPRSVRIASATAGAFSTARAYRHRTGPDSAVGPSTLALSTEGAHAALKRADLAAQFVRPGDLVVNEGGWAVTSAVVLDAGSAARRTIGLIPDDDARDELNARYGRAGSIDFMVPQADGIDRERPDFLFYTADHVVHRADDLAPIAAATHARLAMLTPAGRLFAAVAFAHSTERAALIGELLEDVRRHAIVERLFYQRSSTVPGGADELFEAVAGGECDGDWLIVLAMTSPLVDDAPPFVGHAFTIPADERFEVARFDRAYVRPWIIKGLVARGMRPDNPEVLRGLAADVQRVSPPDSADYAAALCVEAYQIGGEDPDGVDALRERIAEWLDATRDPHAHHLRWQVSLLAALSRLHLFRGDLDAALATSMRCAKLDVVPFSPLLGSKTLEAMHLAAMILLARGEREAARGYLRDAVREARRLLSGDWLNILGDVERPLIFGIPEASQLLAIATRSAALLARFEEIEHRGGAVWALMFDLSGQRFIPAASSGSSRVQEPYDTALDATERHRLADVEQRLVELSAELANAREQATTAYAVAAGAKDQAANAFAQLAEVRRAAAVTVEAAHREMADARGQATTAYALAAAAKDQAASAFATLADGRREAAAALENAHAEVAEARGQATTAYALAAVAKEQAASAFATLAEARREATTAYAAAGAAQERVADTLAQLAEARREAAASLKAAHREKREGLERAAKDLAAMRAEILHAEVQPRDERLRAMSLELTSVRARAEEWKSLVDSHALTRWAWARRQKR